MRTELRWPGCRRSSAGGRPAGVAGACELSRSRSVSSVVDLVRHTERAPGAADRGRDRDPGADFRGLVAIEVHPWRWHLFIQQGADRTGPAHKVPPARV